MSPEQAARIIRTNGVLTGIVAGIMVSLGAALILAGLLGMILDARAVGFAGLAGGISFLGLAAHICPRA